MAPKKEKPVNENTETTAAAPAADAKRVYESATISAVSATVPMPENIGRRNSGARGLYPFDDLQVGESFGVMNKTAKQIASAVSAANKRHRVNKTDANGATVFKTEKVKQSDGSVIERPTLDAETVPGRVFVAADMDKATDPDGATCRVWRKQ